VTRDFLDVDAAITSGRYTARAAAGARRGSRPTAPTGCCLADALGALTQITDAAFAEYRTDPGRDL